MFCYRSGKVQHAAGGAGTILGMKKFTDLPTNERQAFLKGFDHANEILFSMRGLFPDINVGISLLENMLSVYSDVDVALRERESPACSCEGPDDGCTECPQDKPAGV